VIRHVLVLLLGVTVAGEPTSEARGYLDTALDLLQEHSVESAKADWPALRGEAHRATANARTPSDTHAAIERVIRALGNPHTRLLTTPGGGPSVREVPGGRMIGSVAYLKLPRVSSEDGETYLRGNGGGDMVPMLAVAAPLLGDGRTGSFVRPDGTRTDWGIRDGHVYKGERISFAQVEMPPAVNRPVAVLVDGDTASSGEAVLLAFTGAPNARSFGRPTAGFATSNEAFLLPDGARLAITTATMTDRTGRAHGNTPIAPDTLVDSDDALDAAIEWLGSRP
jgi:carboxyl-terminal processing protease